MHAIKTLFFALFLLLSVPFVEGHVPDAFHYQSIVSDQGALLIRSSVQVRFTIRQSTAIGTKVYVEIHETETNEFGMVALQIGKGTVSEGAFAAINWSQGPFFIETEINKGAGFISTGVQQLLSVPYALYASAAAKIELVSPAGTRFVVTINEQGELIATKITK